MPTINGTRITYGRCWRCKVAYRWHGAPRLKDSRCRCCLGRLRPTTHFLKAARWLDQKPALRQVRVPLTA